MSSNKISLVLLMVSCLGLACSAAPADSQLAEQCLSSLEKRLATVEVPEDLKKIVTVLRDLNVTPPQLKEFNLNKLLDSALAETRIVEVGLVNRKDIDRLADLCVDYMSKKITPALQDTCDFEQFFQNDYIYMDYLEAMDKHPEVDLKVGAGRICLKI